MPTPSNPHDTGKISESESSSVPQQRATKHNRPKRGRRPQPSGGSGGAAKAQRKGQARTGTTGSLSATNPGRVRRRSAGSGKTTGSLNVAAVKKSNGVSPFVIVGAAVAVVALLVGGFFVVNNLRHPYEGARVEDGQTVTVTIPEGADGGTIIQTLLDAGVIHSSKDFRRATAEQNADQNLRCGTYTFKTGSDPAEVVKQLVAGPNTSEGQLQVPEGLTVTQTAQLVESTLGIPAQEFLEQAKASTYVDEFPFLKEAANDSLEGYLYPKTYDLGGKKLTANEVIRLMLTQFASELAKIDMDSARSEILTRYGLNATNYDFIKIASIIEEEAINEDDRGKVSSVFYNRLKSNMALQSDATMGYVTGGAISAADLEADSPYNTYKYKGLPPTPICSPSEWALEAAMHPDDTKYLFFFIIESPDYSNHTFSETFEEHDAAYRAALAEQQAASGSGQASNTASTNQSASTSTDNQTQGTSTMTEQPVTNESVTDVANSVVVEQDAEGGV